MASRGQRGHRYIWRRDRLRAIANLKLIRRLDSKAREGGARAAGGVTTSQTVAICVQACGPDGAGQSERGAASTEMNQTPEQFDAKSGGVGEKQRAAFPAVY